MSEGESLLELEVAFLATLTTLHDVFISMVQRETVVPPPTQNDLWEGFGEVLEAQKAYVDMLKGLVSHFFVCRLFVAVWVSKGNDDKCSNHPMCIEVLVCSHPSL
jgi:hypothetical protein